MTFNFEKDIVSSLTSDWRAENKALTDCQHHMVKRCFTQGLGSQVFLFLMSLLSLVWTHDHGIGRKDVGKK